MTAVVTGKRWDQYLVDLGDGRGMIYDAGLDILYPPRSVLTLSAQPYWGDPGNLPANVQQMLDRLNTPSESISAMADTREASRRPSRPPKGSYASRAPKLSHAGEDRRS
jgi:hypothetical protein